MDFWNNKINVSKEAAEQQVAIINKFPSEKRLNIALEFAGFGVGQTRNWIKETHPSYSELEVNLEFVRLMYYKTGQMKEEQWQFYREVMTDKIRKDWAQRFREMMRDNNWTYEDVAKLGDFRSGKVIEATISRGLPAFAKLSVVIHELNQQKK